MKRLDIMVDLETLGVTKGTTIFQIAACSFDIVTGQIHDTFNEIMDISTLKNAPFDGSTLKWWLNTNKDLLADLINKGRGTERELILKFATWINDMKLQNNDAEIFLWGNGILFDNAMIQEKCLQQNIPYPIFYRNDRDVRTIVDLTMQKLGFTSPKDFFSLISSSELVQHDALNDVRQQIKTVSICWNIILNQHPQIKINCLKEEILDDCERMKLIANTNNGFYWFAGKIDEQVEFLMKKGDQIVCSDIITSENFNQMYGVYVTKLYNCLYNPTCNN